MEISNAEILRLKQRIKSLEQSVEEKDKALKNAVILCDACEDSFLLEVEIDGTHYEIEELKQYFKETKKL